MPRQPSTKAPRDANLTLARTAKALKDKASLAMLEANEVLEANEAKKLAIELAQFKAEEAFGMMSPSYAPTSPANEAPAWFPESPPREDETSEQWGQVYKPYDPEDE